MDFMECYMDTVSSLAAAARSGCGRQVRRLIRSGCSLESRDNRGWTPLHEAAAVGSMDCVREILRSARAYSGESFDYVNALTHEGESACYLAAQRGHLPVVRLLLKAHSDINQLTNDESCPLYAAVDNGHREVVELLLKRRAEVNRAHTASCWTCLHQAVYKGHSEIVSLLIKVCNVESVDEHQISPLFLAAQYGQKECLEILINAGADVNTRAVDQATPLLIASLKGHEACVTLLLDHGADPNMACSQDWPQLPIHAAAYFGHISILQKLIAVTDRGCDRGTGMVSPLYLAIHGGRSESVRLLLETGFSPNAQDCTQTLDLSSPLSLALSNPTSKCYRESARLLVAAGAHLSEKDWFHVFSTNQTDLLQLLLHHRWIRPPCALISDSVRATFHGRITLTLQELRGMICIALNHIQFAQYWLPLLLQAGLEPTLLLHPHMFEQADGGALSYLLEFVNWWTLPLALKLVLDRRRSNKTWEPCSHFDSAPMLSHLCRLQLRDVLGPDRLMRTDVIQQLKIPTPLHTFMKFRDIPKPSSPDLPPPAITEEQQIVHQHIHVL